MFQECNYAFTVCSYLSSSVKMATYNMQPWLLLQFSATSIIVSREPTEVKLGCSGLRAVPIMDFNVWSCELP